MIINERNHIASKLVVGIKDKTGKTNALSYSEVQETTNLLSDIASENVVPSILIKIDTIEVEDGNLVFATVKEGLNGENGAFPPTRDGCIHSLSMRERG